MLRQFAASALARAVALIVIGALAGCGIKGPLRLPPDESSAAARTPAPKGNPEARPPLLPSEPPPAIAPADSAKKP